MANGKRENWDKRLVRLAGHVAEWSSDPSTKVGSVIVGPDNDVRALGYNGLPRNIDPDWELFQSPLKSLWIEHAERNAIYSAARSGVALPGCRMYLSWFPCSDCARAIVQVGIVEVICVEPDWGHAKWSEHFQQAKKILLAGSVKITFFKETDV
jgi:dCMP deaminase